MTAERIISTGACVLAACGVVAGLLVLGTPERQRQLREREEHFLPTDFKVYVAPNHQAIAHARAGYTARLLPTINSFKGDNGCYVLVYSHDGENSAYAVNHDTYVAGQIRVWGYYRGRICRPEGIENDKRDDIEHSPLMKHLTDEYFPERKGGTWAGGDTGRWFDLP